MASSHVPSGQPLKRVGVLGDVHCQSVAARSALRYFEQQGVEAVLAVGDLIDGPGSANQTVAVLRAAGVLAVSGNHERWLLTDELRTLPDATSRSELSESSQAYLRSLPRTREFSTVAGGLLLCHGLGENDFAGVRPDDSDDVVRGLSEIAALAAAGRYAFVVNGHTHRPMIRRVGAITLINAGTLLPGHRPVCTLLDFASRRMTVSDVGDDRVTLAADWSLDSRSALDTGR